MVTSAINKESLNQGGYHYDGHTEILAEKCKATDVAMMLTSPKIRVSHVTTHVSLSRAIEIITTKRIATVIRLTDSATRQMGVAKPRIAVSGLNPHAGEHGLFGDEEERVIYPAIKQTFDEGINVTGPYPPDSVFYRASQGQFDATVAMFHDQGHIAIKMLGILDGVNVTLGLPIIRTSVDHGTNFGKAGKGTADPKSLIEAIKLATLMSHNRK
jgi:4-hydroxythreonine-4-phosphate dehydrogenase